VVNAGLTPVFVDCDLHTMNIDPADLESKITERTGAILPVHFAGRPCDMTAIMDLAGRAGLRVVEDCAHAIESTIDGRHCGTFGDYGCFSFYVTKNMTTVEGGMLVTSQEGPANSIKSLALHGMTKDAWRRFSDEGYTHYEVVEPGFKYNLTDLAASLGIHQLARIDKLWQRREQLWNYYQQELKDLPLDLPAPVPENLRHSYHLFTCLVDGNRTSTTRDQVLKGLHELRIGAGVHYTALHLHSYYRQTFHYSEGDLPNTESIGSRTFSIPLSAAVTDEDAADVVRALKVVLE
jgi:dTDP-4-amino-4,6-dideoxygalactose transaminase